MKNGKYIAVAAFCALLGALGQLFFKLGSNDISYNIFLWLFNWKLMLGILLYAAATIIFIFLLKKAELSLAYPVVATSYIWVAIFSVFILSEKITFSNWIGFVLIVGGVSLASVKKW